LSCSGTTAGGVPTVRPEVVSDPLEQSGFGLGRDRAGQGQPVVDDEQGALLANLDDGQGLPVHLRDTDRVPCRQWLGITPSGTSGP